MFAVGEPTKAIDESVFVCAVITRYTYCGSVRHIQSSSWTNFGIGLFVLAGIGYYLES